MIEVESGIPLPDRARVRSPKYPFDEMKVGDSFLIPGDVKKPTLIALAARKRHRPKLFTVRETSEGFRIWRTA